jgi:hypothetical protein
VTGDLDVVVDVAETMSAGDVMHPAFHRRVLEFHGQPTIPADQMVVMAGGGASAEGLFAVGTAQHVDLAVVDHRLQGPVDGGQSDPVASRPQVAVNLLG